MRRRCPPWKEKPMDEKSTASFLGLLGIAKKAGKIVPGTERVRDSIRAGGDIRIVFVAGDVSENTEKRIVNCCDYYEVKCVMTQIPSEKLGTAVGSGICACVGVTDSRFSKPLEKMMT